MKMSVTVVKILEEVHEVLEGLRTRLQRRSLTYFRVQYGRLGDIGDKRACKVGYSQLRKPA